MDDSIDKKSAAGKARKWFEGFMANHGEGPSSGGCGTSASACGSCGSKQGCGSGPAPAPAAAHVAPASPEVSANPGSRKTEGIRPGSFMTKKMSRRGALKTLLGSAVVSTAAAGCNSAAGSLLSDEAKEKTAIDWKEFFKGNYRLMTDTEKQETLERLERRYKLEHGSNVKISGTEAIPGVLYGYAFNISKCKGYRECVKACVEENNQDRSTNMQYIRIFEKTTGSMGLDDADAEYFHEVPAEGHFYIGTQCFQCDNPPCVDVCPTGATWKEKDGIVVIDYDWCIGCRYCQAGCPYWARRFNWNEPNVPEQDVNPQQHYLGNRMRRKGVMEKCTYCIQRTRRGMQPACAEACPTGARVFGNILDPDSEIRWILENKKVFRLKEELNTDPKFWYYMD